MRERAIHCQERQPIRTSAELHPGWVRASNILLVGLDRLRRRENEARNRDEKFPRG